MRDLVQAGLGLALLPGGLALSAGRLAQPLAAPKLEGSVLLTAVAAESKLRQSAARSSSVAPAPQAAG